MCGYPGPAAGHPGHLRPPRRLTEDPGAAPRRHQQAGGGGGEYQSELGPPVSAALPRPWPPAPRTVPPTMLSFA